MHAPDAVSFQMLYIARSAGPQADLVLKLLRVYCAGLDFARVLCVSGASLWRFPRCLLLQHWTWLSGQVQHSLCT